MSEEDIIEAEKYLANVHQVDLVYCEYPHQIIKKLLEAVRLYKRVMESHTIWDDI